MENVHSLASLVGTLGEASALQCYSPAQFSVRLGGNSTVWWFYRMYFVVLLNSTELSVSAV